ncbi:MAG: hypothetical protein ACKOE2_07730 [Actinomycetales bacterium]
MTWHWRCERSTGEALDEVPETARTRFPNQGDAESWLGESWRELLDAGVDQVTLLQEDRVVYGPMSLHPQE